MAHHAYGLFGMKAGIYTISYLIMGFVVSVYLSDAHNVRRCYSGFSNYFFIEIENDQLVVSNEEEYLAIHGSLDSFTGINISAWPQHNRGPLKEGFTFYVTTSFMSDPSSVRITDWGEHSEQQKQQAFDSAVEYAMVHPDFSWCRPSRLPKTVFYPFDAAKAGAGLLGALGLPALASWTLCFFAGARKESSIEYRREHSMCVHCAYSVKGLTTPICPECGQHHDTEISDQR